MREWERVINGRMKESDKCENERERDIMGEWYRNKKGIKKDRYKKKN